MKPMKVAAIIAGSLMAAGAATPAFAADLAPGSLNEGLGVVADRSAAAAQPLAVGTLDTEQKGSLLGKVSGTTDELNQAGQGAPGALMGGLPVGS
ncbi:hypothetical protein ACFU5O_16235 [Streptomyces sp. NPDC057445]|uniref:hypothetical protein n=1 Tax=Streptomyces sp. NPDC057445 TaxID=3346136 RepID=UPI0036B436B8